MSATNYEAIIAVALRRASSGDLKQALQEMEDALESAIRAGDTFWTAYLLINCGHAAERAKNWEVAAHTVNARCWSETRVRTTRFYLGCTGSWATRHVPLSTCRGVTSWPNSPGMRSRCVA